MAWMIEFFRYPDSGRTPGLEFLNHIPPEAAGELEATLAAVEGHEPPFAFKGGLRWKAMRDDMTGWFEARDKHDGKLYRLFVIFDRDAPGLGHSAIVVVGGGVKRDESAFTEEFYTRLRKLRDIYLSTDPRSVAEEL